MCTALTCSGASAAKLAIVIDDLGSSHAAGWRTLDLPSPLTVAVLPDTPFASELATAAHRQGKQVIVHLPMQSLRGHRLGPYGLSERLSAMEFRQTVRAALSSVPFARGASNHMGSLLTTHREPMSWLMGVLAERGDWMFLDSRTTASTVAADTARQMGVPVVSRDVFLDNERSPIAVRRQLLVALSLARRRGHAVAIGHPHRETLSVLERELPALRTQDVELVEIADLARRGPVTDLIYTRYSPPPGGHEASTR